MFSNVRYLRTHPQPESPVVMHKCKPPLGVPLPWFNLKPSLQLSLPPAACPQTEHSCSSSTSPSTSWPPLRCPQAPPPPPTSLVELFSELRNLQVWVFSFTLHIQSRYVYTLAITMDVFTRLKMKYMFTNKTWNEEAMPLFKKCHKGALKLTFSHFSHF